METMPVQVSPFAVLKALNWRYATKIFDPNKKIPEEIFDTLLEVLRLSPSSIGLQPWKFVVVRNPEIRELLKSFSMQQSQLTDASHLILTCSRKHMDESYIDEVIANEKRLSPDQSSPLETFRDYAVSYIQASSKHELRQWMAEQCYIALGFLLTACALLGIDACPIEAIERQKFNEILDLDKYGVEARTAVALGYMVVNDLHAKQNKMRFGKEGHRFSRSEKLLLFIISPAKPARTFLIVDHYHKIF